MRTFELYFTDEVKACSLELENSDLLLNDKKWLQDEMVLPKAEHTEQINCCESGSLFLLYDFVLTKSMLAKKYSYSQRLNNRLFRRGRIFILHGRNTR